MSFREKRAWVTLVTLVIMLLVFWWHIPPNRMLAPPASLWILHVLAITLATFIALELVAYAVIRTRSPRDARSPKDEREQLIELKSIAVAFYVFAILSIGGIFVTLHLGANEIGLGFVVLLAFVLAEIVNYAMRIRYYRRGF